MSLSGAHPGPKDEVEGRDEKGWGKKKTLSQGQALILFDVTGTCGKMAQTADSGYMEYLSVASKSPPVIDIARSSIYL